MKKRDLVNEPNCYYNECLFLELQEVCFRVKKKKKKKGGGISFNI